MLLLLFSHGEDGVETGTVQLSVQEAKWSLSKLISLYPNETEAKDFTCSPLFHYTLSVPVYREPKSLLSSAPLAQARPRSGGEHGKMRRRRRVRKDGAAQQDPAGDGRRSLLAASIPAGSKKFVTVRILQNGQENDGRREEKLDFKWRRGVWLLLMLPVTCT